jgi:hypothetical protein
LQTGQVYIYSIIKPFFTNQFFDVLMQKLLFIPAIIFTLNTLVCAQSTSFDAFTYKEPAGFAKEIKPGVITYSVSNNSKGTFCMIAIGSSSTGTNDLQKDFKNQWQKIAVPFNPVALPEIQQGNSVNGWKMLTGVAQFNKDGTKGALLLSTYSGKNRCASILYILNDTAYQKLLDDFSSQINIISGSAPKASTTNQNNNSVAAGTINYTAPNGWSALPNINDGAGFISPLLECTDNSIYKLYMLPVTNYTGSLQDYAHQMHKAYFYQANSPYQNYKESEKRIVKGIDDKGREYLSFETPAHSFDDNTWRYGMVYLLRNGNTLAAFILELQPIDRNKFGPPTAVYNFIDGCAPLKTIWKKFLSSVTFSNTTLAKTTVPADLEGTWTSRVHLGWATLAGQYAVENSQVVEKYTFNDNGTYVKDEFAKGKTNGTFSINGNKISFAEAGGKKYSYPFTLTSTFEYASWQRALSFFDTNGQEIKLNYETVQ